jgi:hypothetical protein
MANGKQNIKLTAWKAFMKRNLCKVEHMNDSDNVAIKIRISKDGQYTGQKKK